MNPQIEIVVMRVSPNGKYLEFIANCPEDWHFVKFTVQVNDDDDEYSLGESLGFDALGSDIEQIQGAVRLSDLGVSEPSMFTAHLEAAIDLDAIPEDKTADDYDNIYADARISDVSHVYDCLINNIISFDECGRSDIQDKVIRDYLLLYAHQEAMHLGLQDEAIQWFEKLKNCGTNCNQSGPCTDPMYFYTGRADVKPSCGCKK